MQINGLKYFHDACRFQSMTKAAVFNRVSRPAISQAIKKLEDDIGVLLLHHKKRGFELTEPGQKVSQFASTVFDSIDQLKTIALGRFQEDLTGNLRIGVARVLSTYRFDDALSSIKEDHPKVSVRLRFFNSELLLDQLASRELDLAVIISDEMRDGLHTEILQEGCFVLVRPKLLPMEKVTFAITERRPETDAVKRKFADRYSKDMPIFAEVPSWDTIWNWVQRGRSGGLIPDLFFKRFATRSAQYVQVIKSVYPYRICIYVRSNQQNNQLIVEMIQRLRECFQL